MRFLRTFLRFRWKLVFSGMVTTAATMICVSLVFVVVYNHRQSGTLRRDDLPEMLSAGFARYTAEVRMPVVQSPPDSGAIDRWVEASRKWGEPLLRLDPDAGTECEDCDMQLEIRTLAIVDVAGRVFASNPGGPSSGTALVDAIPDVGWSTFEVARATLKEQVRRDAAGDSFVVVPFFTLDGELRGLAYAEVATAPLSLGGAALRFFGMLPREIVPILTFALILGTVETLLRTDPDAALRHVAETRELACGERELPLELEQTLFRVAQEALANVAWHSGAKEVEVRLAIDDSTAGESSSRMMLSVRDHGRGFDPDKVGVRGFGIRGMRERMEQLGGGASRSTLGPAVEP